jgi:cytochrome P450
VRRHPADHLDFGFANHGCAGQGLARLEAHVVLRASRIEHGTSPSTAGWCAP